MDLLLKLPSSLGRRAAVEQALRQAIVDGQLQPGAPLPSTRALAAELGLARGTVVAAVEQLVAEGLLETRARSATVVAHVPPHVGADAALPASRPAPPLADFGGGDPDLTLFPRTAWNTAVRRALGRTEAAALGYGDPRGSIQLRRTLVEYLARTRGVVAETDRIVVTAGFSQTLAVLGRALHATGRAGIAVEDPSYWRHRELLSAAGLTCPAIAVDDDGVRVQDLLSLDVPAVLATPGHHTPLGVSLSAPRRTALAAWAAATDHGLVVEDDYDGELRYDRRPLRALQSLDPARIVYCGTASKSFVPGLRLAWTVVPPTLLDPAVAALDSIGGQSVSIVDQLTLAELLRSRRYDRQVRKIRTEYHRRRDQLVRAVAGALPAVRIEGVAAGLKAVLRLPSGTDEHGLVEGLASRSVAVVPLSAFQVGGAPSPGGPAIVVNYGRPYGHHYRTALDNLIQGLTELL